MSNYPFHDSFYDDLAAFDADDFLDPMEDDFDPWDGNEDAAMEAGLFGWDC